jgi:hypothetical protein
MNAKSERIEQLIQIVNRNLLLIYNGQVDGVTPVEPGSIVMAPHKNGTSQKIDMSVFDGDKFGYEMVNFFRTYLKSNKSSLAAIWERNFVKGLETLMMECAVIKDDIERECFVSRVYVWFTDKLVERRDLPSQHDMQVDEVVVLKNVISAMGAFHSVKALDNLTEQKAKEASSSDVQQRHMESDTGGNETMSELGLEGCGMDQLKLPPISSSKKQKPPEPVLEDGSGGYQPESEAEMVMHELWIARRRQEAFEWKAKQNLNLIMDRRDLNRSRLESEALRREESSSYLAGPQNSEDMAAAQSSMCSDNSRYVPRMRRPLSGKRHFANIISDIELDEDIQNTKQGIETSGTMLDLTSLQLANRSIQVTTINMMKEGAVQDQAKINSVSRQVVQKNEKKPYVPMRFRNKVPDSLTTHTPGTANTAGTSRERKNSGGKHAFSTEVDKESSPVYDGATTATTEAKHDRGETMPEKNRTNKHHHVEPKKRAMSASHKILQHMGSMDSELQVHYQYSLTRKGPVTAEHVAWLQMQGDARMSRDAAYHLKLRGVTADEAAAMASGGKDKKGGNKKVSKKTADTPEVIPPKYSSAKDFMNRHFPDFDKPEHEDAHGPLRYLHTYYIIAVYLFACLH